MERTIKNKIELLRGMFTQSDRIMVAFSGGVDSSFLIYALSLFNGPEICAVTIKTPYIPQWEVDEAVNFCKSINVNHEIISLPIPGNIINNPGDRCYKCKLYLFSHLTEYAHDTGCNIIADGTNSDDASDYRPGMKALSELKIRSPLLEAGFTKTDIRSALKKYGLEIWNKPAYACLLTRLPHDIPVKEERLRTVEKAEQYLAEKGFPGTRVRLHNDIARLECQPGFIDIFFNNPIRDDIVSYLKSIGVKYVTLDLEGYKTGSMNKNEQ